jgi:glycosyltransferase involved in cell wall biosynthesis
VSVVMNCYNSATYLREAIDSVYAQTYSDWEIVFWDNVSTDESPVIARSYDERLRYFRGDSLVPLGAARNLAFDQARGELVAMLDCDDVWLPEKLARQVPLFDDARVGLVCTDVRAIDPSGNPLWRFSDRDTFYRGDVLVPLVLGNFVVCSSVILRNSALAEVGHFSPDLNIAEEYDLFLRVAEKYRFDFPAGEVLALYRVHPTNTSRNVDALRDEIRRLLDASFARRPDILGEIGPLAARVRLAGFGCTLAEAEMLRGRFGRALRAYGSLAALVKRLPRLLSRLAIALLPGAMNRPLLRFGARLFRRTA